MNIFIAILFIACGGSNTIDDKKKKEEPMSCNDACKAYDKDPRKAPKFVKFHYDNAGNKAKESCWEQAVITGHNPAAKCGKEAVDKCTESCRLMRENNKKK